MNRIGRRRVAGYSKMTTATTDAARMPTLRGRIQAMLTDELRAIVAMTKRQDRYGYEYKMALEELIARQIRRVVRDRRDGRNEITHDII
jgi:hypothetical protein